MIAELPRDVYQALLRESSTAAAELPGLAEIRPNGTAVIPLGSISASIAKSLGPAIMDRLHEHTLTFNERQFSSYFYQLRAFTSLPRSEGKSVLEIGPGPGVLTALLRQYGFAVRTMDIHAGREPDIQGTVTEIPAEDDSFDVVCAFEVLQHLPYEQFAPALGEMARCSRRAVFLSLPYAARRIRLNMEIDLRLPFKGWRKIGFDVNRPLPWRPGDRAQRQADDFFAHHWEINRQSYPEKRILEDVSGAGLDIANTFHNPDHPYHFFIECRVA